MQPPSSRFPHDGTFNGSGRSHANNRGNGHALIAALAYRDTDPDHHHSLAHHRSRVGEGAMTDALVIAETGEENTGYRFSWGLAIAGGIVATAVTFFLLTLGSGFGLLLVHSAAPSAHTVPVFLTGGAIYFL